MNETFPSLPETHPALASRDLRMLAAIRHGLASCVATEVSSELARTYCAFTIEFLDKLIIRHTEWPAILHRQVQRQSEVLRETAELLGDGDRDARAVAEATANALARDDAVSLESLERLQHGVDAALERALPPLLRGEQLQGSETTARINRMLREQIASVQDSERDFNQAMQARVDRHLALVAGKVTVTPQKLQDYLRNRFPERRDIEVTSFYEVPGGSSKSTVLIEVRNFEGDGITPLVFRLDREAGSTDTRVIAEAPTLLAMHTQGFPVPEVVFSEPDASKIGLAFIVVRKVEATLGGSIWQPDPQLCDAGTARDLARILAKLHTLDTAALGLRGAIHLDPAKHSMQGLIDNIRGLWTAKKMDPDGTLEACLCWLERHMPVPPQKLSLVHGDVSFHNIMVKDKKVACLLDWELSHLGDPNEDLSYVRGSIEQLMPWQDFLAEYRRHGGGEFSEETGRYYGVWRGVRNLIYTVKSQYVFHTDANPDMRWGLFATYYRMVLLEAAQKVAAAGFRA